ncbi:MAG: hypothetical protein WCQ16_07445 [Verrucomicrobiae bacterium]
MAPNEKTPGFIHKGNTFFSPYSQTPSQTEEDLLISSPASREVRKGNRFVTFLVKDALLSVCGNPAEHYGGDIEKFVRPVAAVAERPWYQGDRSG